MQWLLHNLYIHVYSKHLNINTHIVLAFEREDQSLVKANHIMPVLRMDFFFSAIIFLNNKVSLNYVITNVR